MIKIGIKQLMFASARLSRKVELLGEWLPMKPPYFVSLVSFNKV